jgi:hypothetical protein
LTWRGQLEKAKSFLTKSLEIKKMMKDDLGMAENLTWLAFLYEMQGEMGLAKSHYEQSFEWNYLGRHHVELEAKVGLCRIEYSLNGFSASLLDSIYNTEKLSLQYGYCDHLAALYLLLGTIAWDNYIPEKGAGVSVALSIYKKALIWALRYNRFLLDEILAGWGKSMPINSIRGVCAEQDDGEKMLMALRSWWKKGVNVAPRESSHYYSRLTDDKSLLEAERTARSQEPGDNSTQLTELRPKNWTQKQRFLVNSPASGLLGKPLGLELDRGQVA